jgi:hypothetical protein
MKPEDTPVREPRFRIEEYFPGRTRAWGIFQDRFGRLRRQFTVDIDGTWDGCVAQRYRWSLGLRKNHQDSRK